MSAQHSPTPWHACKDGKCSCSRIWTADYPVCEVTRGKWGDEYPAIRLVGDSSLDRKAEAYIDMFDYGEVLAETATANAQLIVAAVNAWHDPDALRARIAELESTS